MSQGTIAEREAWTIGLIKDTIRAGLLERWEHLLRDTTRWTVVGVEPVVELESRSSFCVVCDCRVPVFDSSRFGGYTVRLESRRPLQHREHGWMAIWLGQCERCNRAYCAVAQVRQSVEQRIQQFDAEAPFSFFGVPEDHPRHGWAEIDWLRWLATGSEPTGGAANGNEST